MGVPGGDADAGAYASGLVARLAQALGGGQNVPQAVLRRLRDLIVPAAEQGPDGGAMLDVQVSHVLRLTTPAGFSYMLVLTATRGDSSNGSGRPRANAWCLPGYGG